MGAESSTHTHSTTPTRSDKGKARETAAGSSSSSSSSTTPSKSKGNSTSNSNKRSAQEMMNSNSTQSPSNKVQKDSTQRSSPRNARAASSSSSASSPISKQQPSNSNSTASSPVKNAESSPIAHKGNTASNRRSAQSGGGGESSSISSSSPSRNSHKGKPASPPRPACVDLPEIPDEGADSSFGSFSSESDTSLGGIQQNQALTSTSTNSPSRLPNLPPSPSTVDQDQGDTSTGSNSSDSSTSSTNLSAQQLHQQQPQPLTLTSTYSSGSFHQCGTARRVKVYELKGETWWDRGTGYCAGVYNEQVDEALLVARKEEKCRMLDGVTLAPNELPPLTEENAGNQTSALGPVVHVGGGPAADPTPAEQNVQYVVVVSESLDTDDVLLKSRVVREDVYQRQQDTLVVWTEPDGTDMALSFQEFEGCHEVWEFLTEVQKHFIINGEPDLSDSPPTTPTPQSPPEGLNLSTSSMGNDTLGLHASGFFILPDPQLGNLEVVEAMLKDQAAKSPGVRERVAESLLKEEYIKKLIPVFNDAEDLEDLNSLHLICTVMQTILVLNDNVIFEYILQDDVFTGVIGMLEYDPEFPTLKASYRDYLGDPTRFRQVVEFSDPTIITKIHQTYRLLYLKDVILARVLDDATFSILNSFVFFHQVDIVNFCMTSEPLLNQLFQIFDPSTNAPEERKHEGVMFLQQLCAMGKQIQLPSRMQLYRTLTDSGLLVVVEYALAQNEQRLRNAAAELLMTMIEYDADSVRSHVMEQVEQKKKPLVTMLAELLHTEKDLGLKTQMAEAMRVLFDTGPDGTGPAAAQALAAASGHARGKSDPDKFLTWFYETDVDHLFSPLRELSEFQSLSSRSGSEGKQLSSFSRDRSALYAHLCDLLCFFIIHHSFRSQYFVLTSEISKRLGSLLHSREKHLRLSALRFFRACLTSNNQYTNRHFIKIDLYSQILSVIEVEKGMDNLVSSACLDFFEHMKKENMKGLINHLVERHGSRIKNLAENKIVGSTFSSLYNQWEKNSDGLLNSVGDSSNASSINEEVEEKARRMRDLERRGMNRSTMDADEENYFNDDDEGEDKTAKPTTGPPASNASLVPYTEDEAETSEDSEMTGATTSEGMTPLEVSIPSNISLVSKRRREEEEEDGMEMMGRLSKRKNEGKESAVDGVEEEGGFIRSSAQSEPKSSSNTNGSPKTTPNSNEAKGKGVGAKGKTANAATEGSSKKISLGLTSSSRKMAAEAGAVAGPSAPQVEGNDSYSSKSDEGNEKK